MAILSKEEFEKWSQEIDKTEENWEAVTEVLQNEFNRIRGKEVKLRVLPGDNEYSVFEYLSGDEAGARYIVYPIWESLPGGDSSEEKLIGLRLPSGADEDPYIIPINAESPEIPKNFIRKNFEILLKNRQKELDDAYFLADQGKTITVNVRNLFGRTYAEEDLEVLASVMSEEDVLAKVTKDGNIRLVPVSGEEKPLIEEV